MRVLVTGAAGFIGSALVRALGSAGFEPVAAVRDGRIPPLRGKMLAIGDLSGPVDWGPALDGVEGIVHLAAQTRGVEVDRDGLWRTNVIATTALAKAARSAGVRRFVFVSSVKVHGERTEPGRSFSASDPFAPAENEPYARSKCAAEQALWETAGGGLECVIVRPPLVYGPGVQGNLRRLFGLVWSGLPIPLGSVRNERSLLFVDSLTDLLVRCLQSEKAAGQTFLAADDRPLSTPDLLGLIAGSLGRPLRLVGFPIKLLRIGAGWVGKGEEAGRLVDSLVVDDRRTRETLEWEPSVPIERGIQHTADWYLRTIGR